MSSRSRCFGLLGFPDLSFQVSPLRTMSTSCDSNRLVPCSSIFRCFFRLHSVSPPGQHRLFLLLSSSAVHQCRPSLASCSCSLCARGQANPMLLRPTLPHHTHIRDIRLALPSSLDVDHIRRLRCRRPDRRQCLHMRSIECAS